MTMITFVESGMTFGPYPPEDFYRIEDASLWQQSWMHKDRVKCVEGILLRYKRATPLVCLIEAKTNVPRDAEALQEYASKLCQKILYSAHLWLNLKVGRMRCTDFPHNHQELANEAFQLLPIVVIKEAQNTWLAPLRDELARYLRDHLKSLGNKLGYLDAVVLNEKMAQKKGFLQQ